MSVWPADSWISGAGVTLLAAVGSVTAGFVLHPMLLRWGVVDRPNTRSSHSTPTVRGGGVGILLGLGAGAVCGLVMAGQGAPTAWLLLGLAAGLAAVSFIDDLRPLPAGLRFSCHVAVAVGALAGLGWPVPDLVLAEWQVTLPAGIGLALGLLWIVGYTNAFNFMDGINGLAAGQAVISGWGMVLLARQAGLPWESPAIVLCLSLAGAALGFLPHNFPQARMFMGDVSSATLGFLLAGLALWLSRDAGWWLLVPMALLHANFVLDTLITMGRRIWRGERWYEAHREHFYQHLIRSGASHRAVTLLELILQMVVLGLMLAYTTVDGVARIGLVAGALGVWLLFFAWIELRWRRTGR